MYTPTEYQETLRRLEAANFSREQGEMLMQLVEDRQMQAIGELATKRDLEDLRTATRRDLNELKHEIAEVRTELKHDIALTRKDMRWGFILVGFLALTSPHLPVIGQLLNALISKF